MVLHKNSYKKNSQSILLIFILFYSLLSWFDLHTAIQKLFGSRVKKKIIFVLINFSYSFMQSPTQVQVKMK